jgi:multidrug efflux system membrane fusion protein
MDKLRVRPIVIALCCVAAIAAFFYMGGSRFELPASLFQIQKTAPTQPRSAERPVRVSVAAVQAEDVPISLAAIGTVQAYNTVSVKTRVDGEITKILFEEGQDVNAGDPLAIIDPRPFAAQLHQQEAMRRNHQAQLDQAIIDLERYEKLVRKDFAVSQQQVDQQRALVEQDRALIENDEAQIEYAKTQLDYTTIRAPISARVGIRLVDQGNILHAADNVAIVVLTQLKPISVVFTLASAQVAQARMTLGRARAPVIAFAADFTTELERGTIDLVDNQVDQTTGTIKLKASFPNNELRLWPGNFVNGRIIVDIHRQGLTVPSAALRHSPRGDYVWVVRADKTVQPRGVGAGQVANDRMLITHGLRRGEQVVTDGYFLLEDGRSIEIISTEPVAPPKPRTGPQVASDPG